MPPHLCVGDHAQRRGKLLLRQPISLRRSCTLCRSPHARQVALWQPCAREELDGFAARHPASEQGSLSGTVGPHIRCASDYPPPRSRVMMRLKQRMRVACELAARAPAMHFSSTTSAVQWRCRRPPAITVGIRLCKPAVHICLWGVAVSRRARRRIVSVRHRPSVRKQVVPRLRGGRGDRRWQWHPGGVARCQCRFRVWLALP